VSAPDATVIPEPGGRPEAIKAVPVRHPLRWVAAAIVLVAAVALANSVATNGRFHWDIVGQFLFDSRILRGVGVTLELTAIAMAIGIVGGTILAVMRLSPNPLVSSASWLYIWFFRGTPVLVQLLFWFDIGALYPTIGLGVPFGPAFVHINANTVITPFAAGILGLGLNEAAYMAEIVRAGIISVDEGQTQAAQSLGMTRMQTMRRIVLPQAMRVIIPPTGNETISMLKTSSLVSVITVADLLFEAEQIYDANYRTIQLLIVASIWYLVMTTVLSIGQYYLERYYGRGTARALPETPLQRLRRNLFSLSHASVEPTERPPPADVIGGPHG
jgi:polar amino acid transport system permease protein